MSDDPRCMLTELLVADCAHCRGIKEEKGSERSDMGPLFFAKYPGQCVWCDTRFQPGDEIRAGECGYICGDCSK